MKVNKVLTIVAYVMIGIGVFSFVTGLMSLLGMSKSIADELGGRTLFRFLNGGLYFMLCGVIHIFVGATAIYLIKKDKSLKICVLLGILTLAWQLAAFIYLFTIDYISIRAAAMVLMPAIYLIVSGIGVAKEVTAANAKNKDGKSIRTRKNFLNFNFSFKRRQFGGVHFKGKRRSAHVSTNGIGKRKHKNRFNLKRQR